MRIRPLGADDAIALGELERMAGQRFADIGMPDVAAHDPPPVAELLVYQRAGRGWVAVDDTGRPVGFVLADVVDGCAHVDQVSVHPAAGGQGIGRRLVDTVARWATARGLTAVTLVTFRDVPWNRPYYERLGFRVLDDHELGLELRARRDAEAAEGLDPGQRVCMRRDLDAGAGAGEGSSAGPGGNT